MTGPPRRESRRRGWQQHRNDRMREQALGGGGLSTVVSLIRRHEPGRTARHDLTHAFYEIVASLPAVAGRGLEVEVMTLDERARKRYDADLLHGEPDILIEFAEG